MKGLRQTLALLLIPLLVALWALPVGAAPQKEKTNEEHAAWFELDPVPATTAADSVVITGKVAGNFELTVTSGDWSQAFVAKGQFAVTVPLSPGANAIHFSGANGHGRFINHAVAVTREAADPEPANPFRIGLALSGSLQADGQSQATLNIVVLDASGNPVMAYDDPLTVVSSDPAVVAAESGVVPVNGAAAVALWAGTVAGTAVISVSAPGLPEATIQVTVAALPVPDLFIILETTGNLQVNNAAEATLTIRIVDARGQVYPRYEGSLTVSTSNADIVQIATPVLHPVSGIAATALTAGTVPGTATITVSGPGLAPATTTMSTAPAPPPPLGLSLSIAGSALQAYSGTQATLTVRVVNTSTGQVVAAYTDPLTITSSNSDAVRVLAPTVIPVNGIATSTLASGTSHAPATITVSGPGLPTALVVVTPLPPAPTRISLALDGVLVAGSDGRASLTVTVFDAANQVAQTFTDPVTITSSNPDAVQVLTPSVTAVNGRAIGTLKAGAVPGNATITVSSPGLPAATITVPVAPPMPPHLNLVLTGTLVANNRSQATLSVTVVDANGAVDRSFSAPISFSSSNSGAVQVLTPVVTPVNGVATISLKAGTAAAPAVITGTAAGLLDSTLTVTPAPQVPSRLTLVADPVNLATGSTSQGTVYLSLKDQMGAAMLALETPLQIRLTSSNSGSIHFGSGQSQKDLIMTTPTAQVTIYGGVSMGTSQISGSALDAQLSSDSITVNAIMVGAPYRFSIDPIPPVPAGSVQTITVRLVDWFGYQVTGYSGSANPTVTLLGPGGTQTALGTVSIRSGAGTFTFTAPAAGSYTIRVDGVSLGGYPMEPAEVPLTVTP